MCQIHHSQAAVCTPHQHQHPSYDPHLWQSSKCYQKDTLGTHGEVPRSREVPLELGRGLGEEHSPIGENWGCNGVEIEFRRRDQKGGEQR